jgi:hypothetical protein
MSITLSTSGAVVLVVLMRGFPKYVAEMVSGGMTYVPSLMTKVGGLE